VTWSPGPTMALDPRALLHRLAEAYPSTWTFSVDGLVGATPEMLVRTQMRLVASRVLAGTIRRTGDDAHDLALAASLARSSKDLGEHEYAVRSVVEALAPFCAGTNVPESPFVLHLANVMHLATDVTGVLRDDVSSLHLAAALHPSAAVCGTPTRAAAALIAELEGMDRGRYAGPVGWLDAAGDGEWGIALRCGQLSATPARSACSPAAASSRARTRPRSSRSRRQVRADARRARRLSGISRPGWSPLSRGTGAPRPPGRRWWGCAAGPRCTRTGCSPRSTAHPLPSR
jgi:hypothetical protein